MPYDNSQSSRALGCQEMPNSRLSVQEMIAGAISRAAEIEQQTEQLTVYLQPVLLPIPQQPSGGGVGAYETANSKSVQAMRATETLEILHQYLNTIQQKLSTISQRLEL